MLKIWKSVKQSIWKSVCQCSPCNICSKLLPLLFIYFNETENQGGGEKLRALERVQDRNSDNLAQSSKIVQIISVFLYPSVLIQWTFSVSKATRQAKSYVCAEWNKWGTFINKCLMRKYRKYDIITYSHDWQQHDQDLKIFEISWFHCNPKELDGWKYEVWKYLGFYMGLRCVRKLIRRQWLQFAPS